MSIQADHRQRCPAAAVATLPPGPAPDPSALCFESEYTMDQGDPRTTFRGLPLTDEQDREIRHYIHTKERSGERWDTPELQAMLADMLNPPEVADDEARDESMESERATAEGEESLDAVRSGAHHAE